ncbi:hypothetical protein F5051DRAFT_444334 [Lentinula edodes]|nr:hypothetical protein F5051DRAFT_444334 [Lentinula edodes]
MTLSSSVQARTTSISSSTSTDKSNVTASSSKNSTLNSLYTASRTSFIPTSTTKTTFPLTPPFIVNSLTHPLARHFPVSYTILTTKVASTVVTTTTTSPFSPSTSPSPSTSFSSLGSTNSHTSAIVGGVIGGGAGLIVVIIALLLFYRYLKRRPRRRWRWRCWKAFDDRDNFEADASRRETDVVSVSFIDDSGEHVDSIGEGRGRRSVTAEEGVPSAGGGIYGRFLAASGARSGVVTPYLLKYSPATLTSNTNPGPNPDPLRPLRLTLDPVTGLPLTEMSRTRHTLDVSRANGGSNNSATDTRDGRGETAAAGSRSTTSGLGRWDSENVLQDKRRVQFTMPLRGEGEREREQDKEQDEIPPTYESLMMPSGIRSGNSRSSERRGGRNARRRSRSQNRRRSGVGGSESEHRSD